MIKSLEDYKMYVASDWEASCGPSSRDPIWKFQRVMRGLEYYSNCKVSILAGVYRRILRYRYNRLSLKLGFSIPINTFGPGLRLIHHGAVVVNDNARIGANCLVNACVVIGCAAGAPEAAPVMGDNIFIGAGAKIIGAIEIANDIAIGANAVVMHDFTEPGITIAGMPAKKVSDKNSEGYLIKGAGELNVEELPPIDGQPNRPTVRV